MNQTMQNLNRFLMLATALWITAGAANAVTERVVNGAFTANASLFKDNFGMIGIGSNPASIPNWTRSAETTYFGIEGELTGLNPKASFGPTNYGGRTFTVFLSYSADTQIYQPLTLPAGYYKIQYDVACQSGQTVTYQVIVTSGGTNHYIHSGTANNAAFETVTGYFGGGGGTAPMIYLQNYSRAAVNFTNVSIQDATPPAPTVSNNTPISQGATVTLTASSPYTSDPNAFTWYGPAFPSTGYPGNNLSFPNAQPGWSGTYSCTVTVNGLTSAATPTTVTVNALPTTFAITASSGANGTVSPDGVTNVNSGGSQAYTIAPVTGYHIDQVLVDGVNNPGVVSSGSHTFSLVTAPHTISASFAINTYNITSSAGANGSISPNGSTSVNHGDSQGYTITPATGYHVADVLVDGGSVGAVTSYPFSSVTAPHTIAASFAINTYNITSSAGANGSISPNGSTSVNYNDSQTYTITPATGHVVATLTVDDSPVPPATSHTFTNVTATHSITATFAPISTTITVTQSAHGTISPGTTTPPYGTDQEFNIEPDTGYVLATLTVDGLSEDLATNYMFMNVTEPHTITATYSAIPTTITVTQSANGSISPDTIAPTYGTDQTFSITPATGYAVDTLTVDGSPVPPTTSHTFTNVRETHTITATYSAIPTTITVTQNANGSISPDTIAPTYGTDQEFSITPATGYAVDTLTVDGYPVPPTTSHTFTNVRETHTITATYSLIPTTITVTQSANGSISPDTIAPTYGTDQTFSITPATGYAVDTLTVDGNPVPPTTSHTFTNVKETHTITATFHTLYQSWLVENHYTSSTEPSLLHYAFGTTNTGGIAVIDSTHITLGQTPATQITGGVVSAVFGRRTNHEGLTYTVEFCDNLGTWYSSTDTDHLKYDPSANPNPVVIATQGDMDAVSVSFPTQIKVGTDYVNMSRTFMRVRVSSN